MRTLYLVGMAPPKDKKGKEPPCPCAGLTGLTALDPRHGVFPNFVMTPLLAALFHLKDDAKHLPKMLTQLDDIMADDSPRRFNVLEKPTGDVFTISTKAIDMLASTDPDKHLWLVFGRVSISAIVSHLLLGTTTFADKDLKKTMRVFLQGAIDKGNMSEFPDRLPRTEAARMGLCSRLCSAEDADGTGMLKRLRQAAKALCNDNEEKVDHAVSILRSCVPLLHNEAYKNVPFGKVQNCFMLGADPKKDKTDDVPDYVYWRYMGETLTRRLVGRLEPTLSKGLSV